tara:strand:- start:47822 stop:48847 length:1026 start_codon:yes stop_codon:yes gene_type:complete
MLSTVFGALTKFRNKLYSSEILKVEHLPVPVIGVGNLTVGGTGKTPMVDYLISKLIKMSYEPGVVSRGYRGKYVGSVEVLLEDPDSVQAFGDEPVMLKEKWPKVPIFLSKKRYEAGLALLNNYSSNVLIADDAFQHRSLYRDLNIVLFDLTVPVSDYKILPSGKLRENISGLSRADVVVLNKRNMMFDEELLQSRVDWIEARINKFAPKAIVLFGDFVIDGYRSLKTGELVSNLADQNIGLVSGLGNPHGFEQLMVGAGFNVEKHWSFKDHHNFTLEDLRDVFRSAEGRSLVVTSKDAVKLKKLDGIEWDNVWSVEITSELKDFKTGTLKEFDETLSRLFR